MGRIFAIGDVHGCLDKLMVLMDRIDIDFQKDQLVFLGDYVDRGPKSKEVVDYLIDLASKQDGLIFLKGNHEEMLEKYLGGTDRRMFLENGGRATLKSYSIKDDKRREAVVPPEHVAFFNALHLYHETSSHIFVHGGLRPHIPLEKQDPWDMLWIRDEFIYSDFDFGKEVIFGHTPFRQPLVLENKIGIDTGAVYGNKLTCVVLPEKRFICV
jgi:serine/threonine protein phosphatase 1